MMEIDHVAIWTDDIEKLKDFYVTHFGGTAGGRYHNPRTGFESYFVSFGVGARLEIMHRADIPANANDTILQYKGITHISFRVGSAEEVDRKAEALHAAGCEILRGPRTTGDGSYELETIDPDGNRLEVMTHHLPA